LIVSLDYYEINFLFSVFLTELEEELVGENEFSPF